MGVFILVSNTVTITAWHIMLYKCLAINDEKKKWNNRTEILIAL